MRLLIDEDSQGKLLVRLLREAGHDVRTARETGLDGRTDAEVLSHAAGAGRVLVTRNGRDFHELHATKPGHAGILVEFQYPESRRNMAASDIVDAISAIEASGWDVAGQFVALNAWRLAPGLRGTTDGETDQGG